MDNNEGQYTQDISTILEALNEAHTKTGHITEETIQKYIHSLGLHDSIGMLLAPPLNYKINEGKLDLQERAMKIVLELREFGKAWQEHCLKEAMHRETMKTAGLDGIF